MGLPFQRKYETLQLPGSHGELQTSEPIMDAVTRTISGTLHGTSIDDVKEQRNNLAEFISNGKIRVGYENEDWYIEGQVVSFDHKYEVGRVLAEVRITVKCDNPFMFGEKVIEEYIVSSNAGRAELENPPAWLNFQPGTFDVDTGVRLAGDLGWQSDYLSYTSFSPSGGNAIRTYTAGVGFTFDCIGGFSISCLHDLVVNKFKWWVDGEYQGEVSYTATPAFLVVLKHMFDDNEKHIITIVNTSAGFFIADYIDIFPSILQTLSNLGVYTYPSIEVESIDTVSRFSPLGKVAGDEDYPVKIDYGYFIDPLKTITPAITSTTSSSSSEDLRELLDSYYDRTKFFDKDKFGIATSSAGKYGAIRLTYDLNAVKSPYNSLSPIELQKNIQSFMSRIWAYGEGVNDLSDEAEVFPFDDSLNSINGIAPIAGSVATLRPNEGRFGGAVAVEEGTTNLVVNPDDGTIVGDCPSPNNKYHSFSDGYDVKTWDVTTTPALGKDFTYSIWMRSPSQEKSTYVMYVHDGDGVDSGWWLFGMGELTDEWKKYSFTRKDLTGTIDQVRIYRHNKMGTIDICCPQLEQLSFSTSFVDGVRASGKLQYQTNLNLLESGWVHFVVNSEKAMTDHDSYSNGALIDICHDSVRQLDMWMRETGIKFIVNGSTRYDQNYNKGQNYTIDITWENGCNPKLYIDGVLKYDGTQTAFTDAGNGIVQLGTFSGGYVNSLLFDEFFYQTRVPSDEEVQEMHTNGRVRNGVEMRVWYDNSQWALIDEHSLNMPALCQVSRGAGYNMNGYINADGKIYFIIKSKYPSDGVSASKVYLDYCDLETTLNYAKLGTDFLVNENNLIAPFTSGGWSLHPNAKVVSDYELRLDADAITQNSSVPIIAIPNKLYSFKRNGNGTIIIMLLDKEGKEISRPYNYSSDMEGSFMTTADTKHIRVYLSNGTTMTTGKYTFKNLILTQSDQPQNFRPQEKYTCGFSEDVILAKGDILTLDSESRKVKKNGVSQYLLINADFKFNPLQLIKGMNHFQFNHLGNLKYKINYQPKWK